MEYPKYPSLLIHLNQIPHSRKTKEKIDTGNTIEYDVTSYQAKKTTVKEQKYNWKICNSNAHRNKT